MLLKEISFYGGSTYKTTGIFKLASGQEAELKVRRNTHDHVYGGSVDFFVHDERFHTGVNWSDYLMFYYPRLPHELFYKDQQLTKFLSVMKNKYSRMEVPDNVELSPIAREFSSVIDEYLEDLN